jgi:carboxymethylenebutenolidase
MWNSFATDSHVSVVAEIVEYRSVAGEPRHAYVAQPMGDEPRPGVVAVHHMPGWDEFYQEFSERIARHGYTVICPDLYCGFGHGTPGDVTARVRAAGGVSDDSVVDDCAAARDWLLAQPTATGKVGILGSCSGGRHSVLAASRVKGFNALVDLWGGGVVMTPDQLSDTRPVAPIDLTADLDTPILGLFGNDDKSPPPDQVDQHEAELQRHSKDYEFHRYDGAGHGFFYYQSPAYRPEAAMDGWGKIFTFFEKHLKG